MQFGRRGDMRSCRDVLRAPQLLQLRRCVRIFARPNALEEILHVGDGPITEAVPADDGILLAFHASWCTLKPLRLIFRVASIPRNSRPPSSIDDSSCLRRRHQSRDSGKQPGWCRTIPIARKYICPRASARHAAGLLSSPSARRQSMGKEVSHGAAAEVPVPPPVAVLLRAEGWSGAEPSHSFQSSAEASIGMGTQLRW